MCRHWKQLVLIFMLAQDLVTLNSLNCLKFEDLELGAVIQQLCNGMIKSDFILFRERERVPL